MILIYTLSAIEHITIGVLQNSQSELIQHLCSGLIVFFVFSMVIAIYLDNQLQFWTIEINNVAAPRGWLRFVLRP